MFKGKINQITASSKKDGIWPQTGKWFFVPICLDRGIAMEYILACVNLQNNLMTMLDNIAMMGIVNIDVQVTGPVSKESMLFCSHPLSMKASNGEQLIYSVRNVQRDTWHLVTKKVYRKLEM
eukprot:2388281-Ditylum_brightwellii.AAC.1